MEDKLYYTPDAKEFVIGMEYQYFKSNGAGDFWLDAKITMYSEIGCDFGIEEQLSEGKIRVKLLDEEDIIQLGFSKGKTNGEYWLQDFVLSGQLQYSNILIEREFEDATMGTWTSWRDIKFEGRVKNKSELEKLMKMLMYK